MVATLCRITETKGNKHTNKNVAKKLGMNQIGV